LRWAATVLFLLSGVSVCFAVVIGLALKVAPGSPLLFGLWSASLALACLYAPRIWLQKVEYLVTDRHVVLKRGLYRRTIERRSISFARILWSAQSPAIGDLDLVRAVPTGALRRRLLLQLHGLAAPDQVWAIIRGAETRVLPHKGDRPLTQRLDPGERVVWSASPRRVGRLRLPQGKREWTVLTLSISMFATFTAMIRRALPNYQRLESSGLPEPGVLIALIGGLGIAMLLVLSAGAYFFYNAVILPARQLDITRYLITNHRVLIQRGREELQLDRERIVDVIPAPSSAAGVSNVFLVLDGPRARALAIGGAFGETDPGPQLRPVLQSLEDADSVSRILLDRNEPPAPPKAA
jgi:hypothetical protein